MLGLSTKGSSVVSNAKINLVLFLNFCKEDTLFWRVLGIIYPFNLILKVLFTILSAPAGSSVTVVKESIAALNWNLCGLPQYESDAYSIASTILFSCST